MAPPDSTFYMHGQAKRRSQARISNGSLNISNVVDVIGSVTSTSPSLHFLLYVHPDVSGPLCISKTSAPNPPTSAGHLLPSNSFLSPRWGGVQIWNNDQKPVNGSSAPQDISLPGVTWSPPVLGSVRDWEIDFLWRLRTVENMIETVQALKALSDLLATISNIVIRDDIAALVFSATEQLKNASALHVSALNPRAAFQASAEAYRKSNKAFFDESLLELLYFPDDQKFAVYLPLFIPVGAPIVLSFQDMYRSWRHGLTST
ncbi:unnamed protein product [Cyprideis torosa]|uniref:Uncharacterized protein n=1 Tax=Cyprideis torosa TaxID=163714 RepID=A0A7R8W8Q4_9CRUS|nr:unnamed protein product [Cyprideis torosa]CAG0888815.1 unnamed protein product [Cyprideis torosa]